MLIKESLIFNNFLNICVLWSQQFLVFSLFSVTSWVCDLKLVSSFIKWGKLRYLYFRVIMQINILGEVK